MLGIAASGIGASLERWLSESPIRNVLYVVVPLGLTAALLIPVIDTTTDLWGRSDVVVEAEAVALELGPLMSTETSVVAQIPATRPLRCYFKLHDLPVQQLRRPDEPTATVYVVVAKGQTPKQVFDHAGVKGSYSDPELISSYPSASLWVAYARAD